MPKITNWRKVQDDKYIDAWINVETATLVEARDMGGQNYEVFVNEDPVEEPYQYEFTSKSKALETARQYMKDHKTGRIERRRQSNLLDKTMSRLGVFDIDSSDAAVATKDTLNIEYNITIQRYSVEEDNPYKTESLSVKAHHSNVYLDTKVTREGMLHWDVPRPDSYELFDEVLAQVEVYESELLAWAYLAHIGGFEAWYLDFKDRLDAKIREEFPDDSFRMAALHLIGQRNAEAYIDYIERNVTQAEIIVTEDG